MKELIVKNIRLLIICFTIMVVTFFGFSSAYGNEPEIIYTRDELSTIVSDLVNDSTAENIFLNSNPVGSIYITTSEVNPGETYGGTWIAFGQGRTIVGVGAATDANSLEKTFNSNEIGGEYNHLLTVAEMPSHKHILYIMGNNLEVTTQSGILPWANKNSHVGTNDYATNYSRYSSNMENSGNSQPHNNIQPYITVFMWKRRKF